MLRPTGDLVEFRWHFCDSFTTTSEREVVVTDTKEELFFVLFFLLERMRSFETSKAVNHMCIRVT